MSSLSKIVYLYSTIKPVYILKQTPYFTKELRVLSKKYPSIFEDMELLATKLMVDPMIGTPLGSDFYKIRMAIKSKGRGKSGGARVIVNIMVVNKVVGLISIYDKSEKENITQSELQEMIRQIR